MGGEVGTLSKTIAFMAFVIGMVIIAAGDKTTFAGLDPVAEDFEDFRDIVESNPLTELDEAQSAGTYPVTTEVEGLSGIPVIGPIIDFFADVGRAIWGFVQTVVVFIETAAAISTVLLVIVVKLGTFTFPGVPFIVQILLWSVSFPMLASIFYIAFRAIRGGG